MTFGTFSIKLPLIIMMYKRTRAVNRKGLPQCSVGPTALVEDPLGEGGGLERSGGLSPPPTPYLNTLL